MDKIKKLRDNFNKIPQPIIYLLVLIASAYASLSLAFNTNPQVMGTNLGDFGITQSGFNALLLVIGALIYWGIMEAVAQFILRTCYSRNFTIPATHNVLKNTIRLFYIFVQLIVGTYGLTIFIKHEPTRLAFASASGIVTLVAACFFYTIAYFVLKNDVIKDEKVYDSYYYFYKIYAIAQALSKSLTLIMVLIAETKTPADIVFASVQLGLVVVALVILYFFVLQKAKKEQIENIAKNQVRIIVDDDIFKGYGL